MDGKMLHGVEQVGGGVSIAEGSFGAQVAEAAIDRTKLTTSTSMLEMKFRVLRGGEEIRRRDKAAEAERDVERSIGNRRNGGPDRRRGAGKGSGRGGAPTGIGFVEHA